MRKKIDLTKILQRLPAPSERSDDCDDAQTYFENPLKFLRVDILLRGVSINGSIISRSSYWNFKEVATLMNLLIGLTLVKVFDHHCP